MAATSTETVVRLCVPLSPFEREIETRFLPPLLLIRRVIHKQEAVNFINMDEQRPRQLLRFRAREECVKSYFTLD